MSPWFDLEKMTNYADNNLIIHWNECLTKLIVDMEKSLKEITLWLKKLGLKFKKSKTESDYSKSTK